MWILLFYEANVQGSMQCWMVIRFVTWRADGSNNMSISAPLHLQWHYYHQLDLPWMSKHASEVYFCTPKICTSDWELICSLDTSYQKVVQIHKAVRSLIATVLSRASFFRSDTKTDWQGRSYCTTTYELESLTCNLHAPNSSGASIISAVSLDAVNQVYLAYFCSGWTTTMILKLWN